MVSLILPVGDLKQKLRLFFCISLYALLQLKSRVLQIITLRPIKIQYRITFFLLFISLLAYGQTTSPTSTGTSSSNNQSGSSTTITLDSASHGSKDGILQDRPLHIIYPVGSNTPKYVQYYHVDNDGLPTTITRREYRQYVIKPLYLKDTLKGKFLRLRLFFANDVIGKNSVIGKLKTQNPFKNQIFIKPDSVSLQKNPKGNTLYIDTYPLDPNKTYQFLILTPDKTMKRADELYEIYKLIADGKRNEAKDKFKKLYPIDYRKPYIITFDGFEKAYVKNNCNIHKAFQAYDKARQDAVSFCNKSLPIADCDECFQMLLSQTLTKTFKDSRDKYKGFIDSLDLFNHAIVNLTIKSDLFRLGLLPLTAKATDKPANIQDLDKRSANFRISVAILNQLTYFLHLMTLQNDCMDICKNLENTVNVNLKKLSYDTCIYGAYDHAKKQWFDNLSDASAGLLVYNPTISTVGTTIFDFKTRNKNYINACFGLVTYGAVYGGHNFSQYSRFNDIAPFIGVNINLRPIDKDLPFSRVPNKTFWMHTAIFAGVSTNSVKDVAGTRYDFFEKASSQLLLGASYRISNAVRINYGTLLFKRADTNPLLDRKIITSAPFVGLNIDLDLKELTTDFNSIF